MKDPMDRLSALRQNFDQAFAAPPAPPSAQMERLIALRIGGEAYALRLSECAGLIAVPSVVPLAGAGAHCLGVTSLRGRLVPVFALSVLLGFAPEAPRWLALTEGAEAAAFAFEALEGYMEASPDAFHPAAPGPDGYPVTTICRGEPSRSVIELSLLRETLSRAAEQATPHKETHP